MNLHYTAIYDSPIAPLFLSVTGDGRIDWCDSVPPPQEWEAIPDYEACSRPMRELQEYFLGKRREFSVMPVIEGDSFSAQALQSMTQIPYGQTCTYGELAEVAGNPHAARAAGNAAAHNHILIFIPCHRIVPSGGGIGRYRLGFDAKQYLLSREGSLETTG